MLVVIPHDGDDDAVRIANDSPYGLSGSVESGDLERAKAVAARIRTGTIAVNGGVGSARTTFRRLQAVRHRPGDGWCRFRGVSRDARRSQSPHERWFRGSPRKASYAPTSTTMSQASQLSNRFENKVIVVTGAAQGMVRPGLRGAGRGCIGRGGRPERRGRRAGAADIGGLFVRTDVSSHESAAAMVAATVATYGGIDRLRQQHRDLRRDASSTC